MKLKDLLEKYGEYEVVDETKTKTWYGTLPEEKSGSIQFEGREGIQIRLEPPKPQSVWDLKSCDKYFLLYADGVVTEYEWRENGYISNGYRDQGNVFLTKEEAKKEIERRKVETLLLKHGGRRWFKCDIANWAIRYNHIRSSFEYGYANVTQHQSCIYFDTKEQAEKAIQEIGKERIIKALFEVR